MIADGIELRPIGISGGYWVSRCGQMYSTRNRHGSISGPPLRMKPMKGRYQRFNLVVGNKQIKFQVHRLVLCAWVGPPPFVGALGRHLDDDPNNNDVSNLAWGTALDNSADMDRNGKRSVGVRRYNSILTEEIVVRIRQMAATGVRHHEIGAAFGIKKCTVQAVVSRRNWKHVPAADGLTDDERDAIDEVRS